MHKILFVTSKDWSLCLPLVLWKACNQIPLALKGRFPGDSKFLSDPQAGKPDMEFRTFTTVRELLWFYCSPVCGSLTGREWVWILCLHPSYCLTVASSLSLDMGCIFFGGFQHLPVDGCSTASCNFGTLAGGDEHTSFYSTILTNVF